MKDPIGTLIKMAIDEDIGTGDITTNAVIPVTMAIEATIESKGDVVLCGIEVLERLYETVDRSLELEVMREDGDLLEDGTVIAVVKGSARSILSSERIALNFLQHLSGIASTTRLFVEAVEGTGVKILDTRKTLPGYRALEKYAVKMGEGENHRMGLYDRYLIKDNHISAAGSITAAIDRVKAKKKKGVLIEVEVPDLAGVKEAAESGIDIIMLDNFRPEDVKKAAEIIKKRAKVEVSGNITLDNLIKFAHKGVDYISVGALTHSAPAADIHMIIG